MDLTNLQPAEGAVKKPKRIGRGQGSGHGGTATKGTKGQQSRTGHKFKKGHEGGQMPIQRRMPKRGFINPFQVKYKVFNVGQVELLVEKYGFSEFSPEILYVYGLLNRTDLVKVLGAGELKSAITFKVNAVSAKAKELIAAAGGSVEVIE